MLLDSLNGVLPPQALEVKAEKKREPVDTKPVEKSEAGRHPQLELQEEDLSKETQITQVVKEKTDILETYDAKGNLIRKANAKIHRQKSEALNLTV